jgi:hypothetical protein
MTAARGAPAPFRHFEQGAFMRFRSQGFFAIGFVCALALGGGVAYAANGGALLMGKSNTETATTGLTNSAGTPLSLAAPAGTAPLRVNNTTRVKYLNVDLIDGIDSAAFALTAGKTGIIVGSATDGDGYVNTAECPTGTIATGGGGYASEPRDFLAYSGPDITANGTVIPNSWFVAASGASYAWVVCYNPRGPVPGAASNIFAAQHALGAPHAGHQKRRP